MSVIAHLYIKKDVKKLYTIIIIKTLHKKNATSSKVSNTLTTNKR